MSRVRRSVPLLILSVVAVAAWRQSTTRLFPLDTPAGLQLVNVTAERAVLQGNVGVRVRMSESALRPFTTLTPEQRDAATRTAGTVEQLAIINGIRFDNGVIEAEIAGSPDTATFKDARGFVGIAFRVQDDLRTYDAFYLRPTNGRADDQVRRNHAAQYISHPAWTWSRLRTETPDKYQAYVDLVPDTWTPIRIEVSGTHARLFVRGQSQPTLLVNDLKTGVSAPGGVALWLDIGTTAHFRHVRITSTSEAGAPAR